ncbi:MAG TPA: beta-ketoacyl-ACP synthase II [Candidatus Saccharimonadales bacterium]|nr:beta-ketoacyl-ACP synthase II [Candidatus Saccharimonadales bacterium]
MADSGPRRVVVTGMGTVSPVGNSVSQSWESLRAGRSGIAPITHFDASRLPVRIAGEVKGFDAAAVFGTKEARRGTPHVHFAMAAAREAALDSGLDIAAASADIGVLIASGIGGLEVIESTTRVLDREGPRRVSPFAAAMALVDMAPGMVSIDLGARGPNMAVVSACASGADAVGQASNWIRQGDAVAVLAGGTEAGITSTGIAMFAAARALSTRNDDPEHASRPFERDRDGFVAAEGSAVLVLEEREHALARGATIHAELLGYAASADAYHITAPDPGGDGAIRCVRRALERAGVRPEDVEYINAHGTGTPLNDLAETRALKHVFGASAYSIPISSSKSMTGHMLGAAGVFEAMVTILAMRDGFLPPTVNLENADPDCDLDYVPNIGRAVSARLAMSTSFGFGGHNACLVFAGGPNPA